MPTGVMSFPLRCDSRKSRKLLALFVTLITLFPVPTEGAHNDITLRGKKAYEVLKRAIRVAGRYYDAAGRDELLESVFGNHQKYSRHPFVLNGNFNAAVMRDGKMMEEELRACIFHLRLYGEPTFEHATQEVCTHRLEKRTGEEAQGDMAGEGRYGTSGPIHYNLRNVAVKISDTYNSVQVRFTGLLSYRDDCLYVGVDNPPESKPRAADYKMRRSWRLHDSPPEIYPIMVGPILVDDEEPKMEVRIHEELHDRKWVFDATFYVTVHLSHAETERVLVKPSYWEEKFKGNELDTRDKAKAWHIAIEALRNPGRALHPERVFVTGLYKSKISVFITISTVFKQHAANDPEELEKGVWILFYEELVDEPGIWEMVGLGKFGEIEKGGARVRLELDGRQLTKSKLHSAVRRSAERRIDPKGTDLEFLCPPGTELRNGEECGNLEEYATQPIRKLGPEWCDSIRVRKEFPGLFEINFTIERVTFALGSKSEEEFGD